MTEPTDAELYEQWCGAVETHVTTRDFVCAFARAVLAKWGTQPQAGAVPQRWKAVPVNPTPEMWKAAKTVPDPNPPYPPHYGLVWDAMLAASPTPPAEQPEDEGISREQWIDQAVRAYRIAGDTEDQALECAAYLWGELDMDDLADPYDAAMSDIEGRGPVPQAAPKTAPGEPDKLMRDCLALLESFDYEDDEDSQSKAFFNAHINADWFFHVKHSIERQLEAKAAPQQEAKEPVMIYHGRCTIDCGEHGHHDMEMLRMIPSGSKLYTAPQPAPQQEAQEPVAYVHVPHSTVEGKVRPVVSFEKYQQDYADGIYSTRIPLYTAPAPAPLSEREAFEAWIEKDGGDLGTFGTPPNMHYRNSSVNNAWVAWKARAAIAAQGGKV